MTDAPDAAGDEAAADEAAADGSGPGYAAALAELETIVAELEGEAVDVDHLSARVQRAAELLGVLRRRIATARMDVSRIVVELEPEE